MKNYLFAPFKDDDDKIDTFNYLQSHLDNESLIMFMGRLESYYDKIISDLSNRCAVAVVDERIIKGLEDEIRELKAENKQLTQTIKYSNGNDGLYDEIVESNEYLEEQIKELKVENIKLSSECWCGGNNDVKAELNALREQELDLIRDKDELKADKMKHILAYDTLQAEYNSLKAENVRLNDSYIELRKEYNDNYQDLRKKNDELKAELKSSRLSVLDGKKEIARLMDQVGSDSGNSSSTHTHTKETEIDAEMIDKHGNVKTIKCYTKDM